MKKFIFRLEAALMARNARLELVQAELANVNSRLGLAEELLQSRRAYFEKLTRGTAERGEVVNPALALQHQRYLDQVREEIRRRVEIVQQLTAEKAAVQARVAEAYRDVRALETLEEKDRKKWELEAKREEQKITDDRNGQRHGRTG